MLVGKARTRNVSAKKKNLVVGPSDRIGANYTPSARHLVLKTIRKKRKRSISRMPHIERWEGLLVLFLVLFCFIIEITESQINCLM